jgi:septal ring factor EnvC (AmiA/AmiB activator)
MIRDDMQDLARYQKQLEQKEALEAKLTSYRKELKEEQIEASLKKREIEALEQSKERTLEKVRTSRASFSRLIKDLESQAEKLQSLVKDLSIHQQTPSSQQNPGFGALKGKLMIPLDGGIIVSSHRGLRGVSLKAPAGTTVRAVYAGRVVYAGWFTGYGNLLIIDHGDKFHTVMGNASELLKKETDWVEAGEPVAKVGTTGTMDGSFLYFEIRQGGIPVNPMEWFSSKDQTALK